MRSDEEDEEIDVMSAQEKALALLVVEKSNNNLLE